MYIKYKVLKSGPDRTVRLEKPWTSHNHGFLCSRTGLCPKSREPFESRFNRTVLRTVIRPLLTVPFESEPSQKKKKKNTEKQKKKKHNSRETQKHNSLSKETQKENSLSKEKKKVHHVCHCYLQRNTTCIYVFSSSLFRAHHAAPSLQKLFSWAKQALNSSFVLRC